MADHDPTTVDLADLLARVIEIQGYVAHAMPAIPVTDITGADRSLRYAYGFLTRLADEIRDLRASGRLLPEGGQTREERGHLKPFKNEVETYWSFVEDGPYRKPNRVRTVTEWPDGSTLIGPWEPVPDTDGGEQT